jgi:hypothetical protein
MRKSLRPLGAALLVAVVSLALATPAVAAVPAGPDSGPPIISFPGLGNLLAWLGSSLGFEPLPSHNAGTGPARSPNADSSVAQQDDGPVATTENRGTLDPDG